MVRETEITFHLSHRFRQDAAPYLERTGAGMGELFLKSMNFNLRCSGKPKIDLKSCEIASHQVISVDAQGNRETAYVTTLRFIDDAHDIVKSFFAGKAEEEVAILMMRQLDAYVRFLDRRPTMKIGISRVLQTAMPG